MLDRQLMAPTPDRGAVWRFLPCIANLNACSQWIGVANAVQRVRVRFNQEPTEVTLPMSATLVHFPCKRDRRSLSEIERSRWHG